MAVDSLQLLESDTNVVFWKTLTFARAVKRPRVILMLSWKLREVSRLLRFSSQPLMITWHLLVLRKIVQLLSFRDWWKCRPRVLKYLSSGTNLQTCPSTKSMISNLGRLGLNKWKDGPKDNLKTVVAVAGKNIAMVVQVVSGEETSISKMGSKINLVGKELVDIKSKEVRSSSFLKMWLLPLDLRLSTPKLRWEMTLTGHINLDANLPVSLTLNSRLLLKMLRFQLSK